jgi:uncharacterized protein (TIGR03437 family)
MWAQQSFVPTVIATPGSPSTILFGVYGGALSRSADSGKTWTPIYITQAGLPQPPVNGFAVDPLNSSTVYLATTYAGGMFWKSTDTGQTWVQAASGLPATGAGIDYFTAFPDTITYLYAKVGGSLYKSSNGAQTWIQIGYLPTSSGTLVIAESQRTRMFYIDAASLMVYSSYTEGTSWQPTFPVSSGTFVSPPVICGASVPYFDPSDLYVTVNLPGAGIYPYASLDGAAFVDQTSVGLGPFSQILSASTGPTYALTSPSTACPTLVNPSNGFYRSSNSGQSWQTLGNSGLDHYGATTIDPVLRTILYGVETIQPSTTPAALVQSLDSGNTWTAIPATISPTIGKPVPMFNVTVEQGAPYSVSFNVQTVESKVWQTPVTISTSGEPWLQLGATSGTTPLANSITITTSGLLPGTYTSTITISAPQTFNKTVSVPVQLTVKPLGSLGPGYLITTAAGTGNGSVTATSGAAASTAIGDARALAIDPAGNVLISGGNFIWELTGAAPSGGTPGAGTLTALAGNGTNGSNGDGTDPLNAEISDPDAIAFDTNGAAYFTEYTHERVRKLTYAGNNFSLSTALDMTLYNNQSGVGSHSVVLDPAKGMYFTSPAGIWNFNGSPKGPTLAIPVAPPFSNPYSMIEDASGNLYVSDMGLNQIIEVTPAGAISVIAGTGLAGFSGDGGPATQATLSAPAGIAFDSQGTMYIADSGNNRIRTITTDGNIHTIAGSGVPGFAGDGSTSDFASFMGPLGVTVDASGNVYVADTGNNRVRILSPQSVPTPQPQSLRGVYQSNQLAPGAIFVLKGVLLAPVGYSFTVTSGTWPRTAPANSSGPGAVSVTINGVAAPLWYVSPTQINGQIPFETALGTATAVITVNGSTAGQINFPVVAAAPDVITQNGSTQAVAQNASEGYTINSPTSPAHPGDIEVVWLSGIGQTNPPVATAAAAPSTAPFAMVNYPYQITLNGEPVTVYFLGYAPGLTADVQANIALPTDQTGDLPLVVTVNGQSSVPTIISVR